MANPFSFPGGSTSSGSSKSSSSFSFPKAKTVAAEDYSQYVTPSLKRAQQQADQKKKKNGGLINSLSKVIEDTANKVSGAVQKAGSDVLKNPVKAAGNVVNAGVKDIQGARKAYDNFAKDAVVGTAQGTGRAAAQLALEASGTKSIDPKGSFLEPFTGKGVIHHPKDLLGYAAQVGSLWPSFGFGKGGAKAAGASKKLIASTSKLLETTISDTSKLAKGKDAAVAKSAFGVIPKVAEGDTTQSLLNAQAVRRHYQDLAQGVHEASKGMSEHDVSLIDQIESASELNTRQAIARVHAIAKKADNPDQFKGVVALIRNGYNTRLAGDVSLGRKVGVRKNYLPHLFDTEDPKTAKALANIEKQAKLTAKSTPGYVKPRKFNSYEEALGAGLKRKNANALDDFYTSMDRAAGEHGSQALGMGLNEAHPGQLSIGKIGRNIETGAQHVQLRVVGGENYSLPKELATQYNARAPQEAASNKALRGYDAVNQNLKYIKLGGGTFHAITETGNIAGQQLASGNLFRHPIDNLRVVAGTLSKVAHEKNWERLASDAADHPDGLSSIDRMRVAGVTDKAEQILADANSSAVEKLKGTKFNFIRAIHDAIFQRQIPEGKALIFKQKTRGLDTKIPADLEKMRSIASGLNNGLGGINRAVEGLTPKTAQRLSRLVLATDFTEGKFRTLARALALHKWAPANILARQMVVGKTIVFALPGLTALVAAGKLDPTDTKALESAIVNQIFNPSLPTPWRSGPTKSNPNGVPQTAKFPATFVSEFAKIIKPMLDPMESDKLSGAKDYASARLAVFPSATSQLVNNRDFFGKPLYGTDEKGNPISPGKAAANVGGVVSPIPFQQAGKSILGEQSIGQSVLNTAGFRVSGDTSSLEGKHAQAVTDLFNTYNKVEKAKSVISRQITTLVTQGKINQAKRKADEWNQSLGDRLYPFQKKYANDYNPAWNKYFEQLVIKTSENSFKARKTSSKLSNAVLR